MSRPAVYPHFKNKEEVFRAVGERLVAELVEAATGTALEPSSSDEQARRLRRLVDLVAVGLTDRSPRRSDGAGRGRVRRVTTVFQRHFRGS